MQNNLKNKTMNSIIYYVIKKVGTDYYYDKESSINFNSIQYATKFESEEFAFGAMKQYAKWFLFPCTIEKIYHLK